MPVDNWIKLYDNSDPTQLSRTGKICKRIRNVYEEIEYSFIDAVGVTKEFVHMQSLRIDIEIMKCKQIHSNDFSTQIHIDLLQDEIDKIDQSKEQGKKLIKLIPWVEHEMGFKIDKKNTMVSDFYEMVNFILEKNKK